MEIQAVNILHKDYNDDEEKYSQVLEKEKLMNDVKEIDAYIVRNYKKSTDK